MQCIISDCTIQYIIPDCTIQYIIPDCTTDCTILFSNTIFQFEEKNGLLLLTQHVHQLDISVGDVKLVINNLDLINDLP